MAQNNKTIVQKNKSMSLLKLQMPKGLTVEMSEEGLILTQSWFNTQYFWIVLLALYFTGMGLYFAISTDMLLALIISPINWIGLGLTYFALTGFLNHTKIRVTATHLKITPAPLPYWGHKKIERRHIMQLFSREMVHKNKDTIRYSYEVHIMTQDRKLASLITGLDTPLQALYLEHELERFLEIDHQPVTGELVDDDLSGLINWKVWQSFAQQHNLTFTSGKVLEAFCVEGDYHGYDFNMFVSRRKNKTMPKLYLALSHPDGSALNQIQAVDKTSITSDKITTLFDLSDSKFSLTGKFEVEAYGQTIFYEKPEPTNQVDYLHYISDLLLALMNAYPQIVALGGEAVPLLQPLAANTKDYFKQNAFQSLSPARDHALNYVAAQLVQNIAENSSRLKAKLAQLVCPRCFVHCAKHQVTIPGMDTLTYYGCYLCHQSNQFFVADEVIAVLDSEMSAPTTQQNSTLRVNWLSHRAIFDFDAIEIMQASDEDVERFAVQVGNDTDPTRKSRYQNMVCTVSDECDLSQNTMRILDSTFGTVEVIAEQTTRRLDLSPLSKRTNF